MHREIFFRAIINLHQTFMALACVAFLILATTGAFSAEPRRVLMVHAFGHAYSPWSDMAGSFRAELIKQSKEPIDLYEVSLFRTRRRGDRMNACMSAFG
jgi:hypothetical protein